MPRKSTRNFTRRCWRKRSFCVSESRRGTRSIWPTMSWPRVRFTTACCWRSLPSTTRSWVTPKRSSKYKKFAPSLSLSLFDNFLYKIWTKNFCIKTDRFRQTYLTLVLSMRRSLSFIKDDSLQRRSRSGSWTHSFARRTNSSSSRVKFCPLYKDLVTICRCNYKVLNLGKSCIFFTHLQRNVSSFKTPCVVDKREIFIYARFTFGKYTYLK